MAGKLVKELEEGLGKKIACLEEIAWRSGWIADKSFRDRAVALSGSGYGQYLLSLLSGN